MFPLGPNSSVAKWKSVSVRCVRPRVTGLVTPDQKFAPLVAAPICSQRTRCSLRAIDTSGLKQDLLRTIPLSKTHLAFELRRFGTHKLRVEELLELRGISPAGWGANEDVAPAGLMKITPTFNAVKEKNCGNPQYTRSLQDLADFRRIVFPNV